MFFYRSNDFILLATKRLAAESFVTMRNCVVMFQINASAWQAAQL